MEDREAVWQSALTYAEFIEQAEKNIDLWHGIYRTAQVPSWAIDQVPMDRTYRLLAIAEDWCGDATNTLPLIAKWASELPGVELRVVRRDQSPEVMDQYLTNGARSIPIVVVWDEQGNELGVWGPRPTDLQRWVMDHKETMPSKERYPHVRRWYAKDRGKTTLEELLGILNNSTQNRRASAGRLDLQPG